VGAAEAVSGFGLAVTLLTRVPMPRVVAVSPRLAPAVPWFPVVGALVGAATAGVFAAALLALPPLVAAALAIGSGVLLTGAFHEDGLGDTADALAGGWTRKERLRILHDPRLGTYGVSAVVISLLLRVSALAALGPWEGAAGLMAAHALGRTSAVGMLAILPAATEEGLGASYAAAVGRGRRIVGVAAGVFLGAAVLGGLAIPAILVAAVGASILGLMARRKLGGITGDVLGATEQTVEVIVLLVVAAAVTNEWAAVPWWR
jgi:adenosylcobinamide-GDP ribazoletransferase